MKKTLFLLPVFFALNALGQSTVFTVEDYRLKKNDVVNCTSIPLGNTENGLGDIDFTADGRLWGLGVHGLCSIDTLNGHATPVEWVQNSNALVGLDNHTLLMESDGYLLALDVAGFVSDTIGNIGYGATGDMAWFGNSLYMVSVPHLVKIDVNASVTAITGVSPVNTQPLPDNCFAIATLYFPGRGIFWSSQTIIICTGIVWATVRLKKYVTIFLTGRCAERLPTVLPRRLCPNVVRMPA